MRAIPVERTLPFVEQHYKNRALNDDPHAHFAELRRRAPICRTSDLLFRGRQGYMLTRYEDVRFVLTDRRFSSHPESIAGSSDFGLTSAILKRVRMLNLLSESMVLKDDPDHRRLRGVVSTVFTNRAVQQLEHSVQETVDGLVDDLSRKQTVDLAEEFSVPLPLAVISEMLGVEPGDRDDFSRWMKELASGAAGQPLQLLFRLPAGYKMLRLFERMISKRQAAPDGKLISEILNARFEGNRLDDQEVLAMIFLLLLAGHDTTANLISMSMLTLLEHPERLDQLRDDPAVIGPAVDELLRYTTPVTSPAPRVPTEDVEIGGVRIAKGAPILGMIISANRDDTVFDDPDTLCFTRDRNPHLGFGFGSHMCLGLMLARLETRIALTALLRRFGRIELAVPRGQIHYKAGNLRGLESLPLRLRE